MVVTKSLIFFILLVPFVKSSSNKTCFNNCNEDCGTDEDCFLRLCTEKQATISCKDAGSVIKVSSFWFGRIGATICNPKFLPKNINCTNSTLHDLQNENGKRICDNETSCTFKAFFKVTDECGTSLWSDPCEATPKYIDVDYTCIKKAPHNYYADWAAWGPCSTSCGSGQRNRSRDCIDSLYKNCTGSECKYKMEKDSFRKNFHQFDNCPTNPDCVTPPPSTTSSTTTVASNATTKAIFTSPPNATIATTTVASNATTKAGFTSPPNATIATTTVASNATTKAGFTSPPNATIATTTVVSNATTKAGFTPLPNATIATTTVVSNATTKAGFTPLPNATIATTTVASNATTKAGFTTTTVASNATTKAGFTPLPNVTIATTTVASNATTKSGFTTTTVASNATTKAGFTPLPNATIATTTLASNATTKASITPIKTETPTTKSNYNTTTTKDHKTTTKVENNKTTTTIITTTTKNVVVPTLPFYGNVSTTFTWREFCPHVKSFQEAVAKLLTDRLSEQHHYDQIVINNLDNCKNSKTDERAVINFYVKNKSNEADEDLTQAAVDELSKLVGKKDVRVLGPTFSGDNTVTTVIFVGRTKEKEKTLQIWMIILIVIFVIIIILLLLCCIYMICTKRKHPKYKVAENNLYYTPPKAVLNETELKDISPDYYDNPKFTSSLSVNVRPVSTISGEENPAYDSVKEPDDDDSENTFKPVNVTLVNLAPSSKPSTDGKNDVNTPGTEPATEVYVDGKLQEQPTVYMNGNNGRESLLA